MQKTKWLKSSNEKIVYQQDNYVYSELLDIGNLFAKEFMTFYPDNDELEDFKKQLKKSYSLAVKYYNCEIVEMHDDIFITKCPKYVGELNDLMMFNISDTLKQYLFDELINLIIEMKNNKVVHHDFAFRNICYTMIDDKIKLHLIDFEQLYEDEYDSWIDKENIKSMLCYIFHDMEKLYGTDNENRFLNKLFDDMKN